MEFIFKTLASNDLVDLVPISLWPSHPKYVLTAYICNTLFLSRSGTCTCRTLSHSKRILAVFVTVDSMLREVGTIPDNNISASVYRTLFLGFPLFSSH